MRILCKDGEREREMRCGCCEVGDYQDGVFLFTILFVLHYVCVWKRKRLVWFFCQVAQVITTSLYIIIINVEY